MGDSDHRRWLAGVVVTMTALVRAGEAMEHLSPRYK